MATIGTSTQPAPFGFPGLARIDRATNGHLWMAKLTNAGTGVDFYRSTNGGGSWTLYGTWTLGIAILEMSGLHIDNDGHMGLVVRTNEASQDRIYWVSTQPGTGGSLLAGHVLVGNPGNGGVAGAIHTGMDLQIVLLPDNTTRAVIAAGTTFSGKTGVTLYGARRSPTGVMTADNGVIAGTRQWMFTGAAGRVTPQIDIEHVGDGKSSAAAPHLWVSFGRTELRLVKLGFGNNRWTGPSAAVTLRGVAAQDSIAARWDGNRFLQAVPHPDAGFTDRVLIAERNRANSATTWRNSPVHPTGVVRFCTISCNSITGGFRVFAVGTSTNVVYYCDFIRATSTFTAWTQVSAAAVLNGSAWGVRHETYGNARYDVVHAEGASPFTLVHTALTVTYPPDVPLWVYGSTATTPMANGAAWDVTTSLTLDWAFSDPDPDDSQTAYALSRQIGAGTVQYWRASDSTWQAAEVKNVGGTSQLTLTTGQWVGGGGAGDSAHVYKVKVWDEADTASLYSEGLVVVPSAKVNPTLTAPAAAAVIAADTVTATWTVAEQSAYRVTLATNPGGLVTWDTGWIGGNQASYTPPVRLPDGSGWTITVQTRNSEGLPSTVVSANFTVDYLEPPLPAIVAAPMPDLGVIRVAISNPAPTGGQPVLADQDLYRRVVGDTSDGMLVAAGLPGGAVHDDWNRVRSGVAYEYRVLARGNNGTSIYGPWTA